MFQFAFLTIAALGATDCRNSANGISLERLGDLAEALPKLPGAPKPPLPGNGIVRFKIGADGKALSVEIVCRSSSHTGKLLKNLVSAIHFRLPDEESQSHRHTVGLTVDIGEDATVKISDFSEQTLTLFIASHELGHSVEPGAGPKFERTASNFAMKLLRNYPGLDRAYVCQQECN